MNIDVAFILMVMKQDFLAKTVAVPADSTLVVIGKDSPIYLEEGDQIEAIKCSQRCRIYGFIRRT